jgi:hypothetical protein
MFKAQKGTRAGTPARTAEMKLREIRPERASAADAASSSKRMIRLVNVSKFPAPASKSAKRARAQKKP